MKPFLALALALAAVSSGCTISEDEEMKPRTPHTVTATASVVSRRAVPKSVPVPPPDASGIAVGARSWVRGSTLHVAGRQIDLAPLAVDAWVVVEGGVYFLDGEKLWLTDLTRIRDTGLDDVKRLASTTDESRVVVRFAGPERPTSYAFDTRSGKPVDPAGLSTVPAEH